MSDNIVTVMDMQVEIKPQLVKKIDIAESHNAWAERLASVLGDGRNWEYRGECGESERCDGVCSCGHTGLRYLFTIHNKIDNRTAIVGSSCIETYGSVNPDMVGKIQTHAENLRKEAAKRIAAAKKAIKDAETEGKIQTAIRELSDLMFMRTETAMSWIFQNPDTYWKPYAVYKFSVGETYYKDLQKRKSENPNMIHPSLSLPVRKTKNGMLKVVESLKAKTKSEIDWIKKDIQEYKPR